MKQRQSVRARLLEQLRLGLERLLLRGLHYRLLLAAFIVLLVASLGGLLMLLLDPGFDEIGAYYPIDAQRDVFERVAAGVNAPLGDLAVDVVVDPEGRTLDDGGNDFGTIVGAGSCVPGGF